MNHLLTLNKHFMATSFSHIKIFFPLIQAKYGNVTKESHELQLVHAQSFMDTCEKIVEPCLFCSDGTKHVAYTCRSAHTCISLIRQFSENMGGIVHQFELV